MEWKHAAVVLARFEEMSRTTLIDLKQHYRRIQQLDAERDREAAVIEKNNAKRLMDKLVDGLHKILAVRNEMRREADIDAFDGRLEPTRLQIQSTISAFDRLLRDERRRVDDAKNAAVDQPQPSTARRRSSAGSATAGGGVGGFIVGDYSSDNIFDDCFGNEEDTADSSGNIYEKHLIAQTQLNPQTEEMRLRAEQAQQDAEASQKLAEEIEDLNQVMMDLSQLVHNQHELVDSIEEHIERSNQEVQAGHQQLRKAVKSNNAKYPFVTALMGSVAVGGPVGVVAGSAFAGVAAAVGGAVAGLYGGRAIKKQVQKEAMRE